MIILGIETSCDETAAAVVRGTGDRVKVLSNVVSSQIKIHKKYGGVVPEIAAREHVLNILPVVDKAVKGLKKIDAIAVTTGSGLVTSLLVGVETAKVLAYARRLPVVDVNHIEGHIYANFIDSQPNLPAVVLTVSGGHTMLILMTGHGKYRVLGETRDDAAGEAFDKAAQLLDLGYPGGPAIAKQAEKFMGDKLGVKSVKLPRPMMHSNDFDFSFSGLKTALFYQLERNPKQSARLSEYAAEFQQAAIDVLVAKTIKAVRAFNCRTVMLSGGVAANSELRRQLADAVKQGLSGVKLIIPQLAYCTDNAAMIATAGYYRAKRGDFRPWQKLRTEPNQELA